MGGIYIIVATIVRTLLEWAAGKFLIWEKAREKKVEDNRKTEEAQKNAEGGDDTRSSFGG